MSKLLWLYEQVLKLYPKEYRARYAEQMTQTLRDMLSDQPTRKARTAVWLQLVGDAPHSIIQQHLIQLEETMTIQMPTYAKQSTLFSALLLVPFFIIVFANAVHPLPLSWKHLLYTGAVILPAIAFFIGVITLVRWLSHKRRQTSIWTRLKHLSVSWPLLATPLLALLIVCFVLGHDSVHCLTDNPIKALRNAHQIMECVGHG